VLCLLLLVTPTRAQRSGMFQGSADDPGIRYNSAPLDNVIDRLNQRLDAGAATLKFEGRGGYLKSAVEAIGLPVDSQLLLYSTSSLQGRKISPSNPRAILFNDRVQLGWVRGAELIEVAAQDSALGIVFYTLEQKEQPKPRFKRVTLCLGCHMTGDTGGVPGLLMFSSTPESDRRFSNITFMNQAMPFAKRFGGWLVTGAATPPSHLGNALPALDGHAGPLTDVQGLYDAEGYLAHTSDIGSLMVFTHQTQAVNLMIRAGWEARAGDPALHPEVSPDSAKLLAPVLEAVADDVVDALLFIDEAKLDAPVRGTSGFAERFAAEGPKDKKGRSLRELDLTKRLMKYPCSYLIYSPLFDGLPTSMKTLVYRRLWEVLSGSEKEPRYRNALSLADRRAIVEILRDTKPGLPPYFTAVAK
jgi:hypothetical protein